MSICKECGKEFVKKSYQQEYCEHVCKLANARRITLQKKRKDRHSDFEQNKICKCPVCDITFEKVFSTTWRQQKYCSSSCRKKAEYIFGNKTETHAEYIDKTRFDGNKHHALIRDNFQCYFCKSSIQLVVHHLDCSGNTDNTNNEMDNLVTLCKSCHKKLHYCISKLK